MSQIPAQAKQLFFHATSLHDTTKPRVMEQTRPMQHTNAYNGVNSWKSKRQALLTQSKPRCHDANSFTSKIPVLTSRTFLAVRKDIQSISKHQSMIRAGSELDPTMFETVIRNPPRNRGCFSGPPRPFCIENYNISRSGYHSKFHRILRLPRKMTLELHQILRLPRKMTRIIDPHDMSHVIYNAQRNSTHPPTSLNTAPATQNETHD